MPPMPIVGNIQYTVNDSITFGYDTQEYLSTQSNPCNGTICTIYDGITPQLILAIYAPSINAGETYNDVFCQQCNHDGLFGSFTMNGIVYNSTNGSVSITAKTDSTISGKINLSVRSGIGDTLKLKAVFYLNYMAI